ncbi:MAG: TolC family protein [Thiobacillaceae bacterium]
MTRTIISFCWGLGLAMLTGCASLDPKPDIEKAGQDISSRIGLPVHWQADVADTTQNNILTRALLVQPLSAEAAVQVALLNSPRVAELLEEIGIARADVVQASLLRNPVLDAARLVPRHEGSAELTGGIGFDLLSLLSLPARRQMADRDFEVTRLRITGDLLAFAGEVRVSYIEAVAARQIARAWDEAVAAADASAELAYRLNQAGNLNAARRDRELLAWQEARRMQAVAALRVRALSDAVQVQLGVPDSPVDGLLPPSLPPLPQEEVALADLEKRVAESSLGLQTLRAQLESQAKRMGYDQATALVPELHAGFDWDREAGSGEWRQGSSLGVQLPLFDLGSAHKAKGAAEFRKTGQQLLNQQRSLGAQARNAAARLTQARATVQQFDRVILPLAARVVEANQLQYNAMQISAFELLANRRRELDLTQAHIESLRDYWLARAAIDALLAGAAPASFIPSLSSSARVSAANSGAH